MAQQFLLPCSCGHDNLVRPQQAGASTSCVNCGQIVQIPQLRALRQLSPASGTPETVTTSTWGLGHGIVFSTGLGLLLLGLSVAVFYGFRRAGLDVSQPPPIDPRLNSDLQQLDPLQAWTLWEEVRSKPLFRMTPRFLVNRALSSFYLRIISGAAVAIGIGGCLMAGALMVGRSRPKAGPR